MKLKKCGVKTGPMKLKEHNETNLVDKLAMQFRKFEQTNEIGKGPMKL